MRSCATSSGSGPTREATTGTPSAYASTITRGKTSFSRDGTTRARPLLDLSGQITTGGERGLLGIALHPGFPADPRIFVDYTDRDGNTVVMAKAPFIADRLAKVNAALKE